MKKDVKLRGIPSDMHEVLFKGILFEMCKPTTLKVFRLRYNLQSDAPSKFKEEASFTKV